MDKDESIKYILKVASKNLLKERQEEEGKSILNSVIESRQDLKNIINDEEKIENKMSIYGGKVISLELKIKKIQEQLKNDIENTKDIEIVFKSIKMKEIEIINKKKEIAFIKKIQKVYRGYCVRKIMSKYILERTVRVWDAENGRGKKYCQIVYELFYFSTVVRLFKVFFVCITHFIALSFYYFGILMFYISLF